MHPPLVTVICLCFNHDRFVREAITSVLNQTYPALEIIVVDDHSTDNSVKQIREVIKDRPDVRFLALSENLGNCRAFNEGLKIAKGEFIVDFATDDIMRPERIARQVSYFETHPDVGVVFTDAEFIDEKGAITGEHYQHLFSKGLLKQIPEGDVYADVLKTYFISAPTMLVRRAVFDKLGGYDGSLAYEDFDFWVRSARHFRYGLLNEKLTQVRISKGSLSSKWYGKGDRQVYSTYLVCKKAFRLNANAAENHALAKRLRFEIRQCVFSENFDIAVLFHDLLKQVERPGLTSWLMMQLNKLRLPLSSLRKWYHRLRYS